ncbi:hypothetical protein AB1K84_17315 [Mesobacillus foraminis]|uniref:exo-rhamnogalacturonan lyase family protein n=1 Tax=Mesobacillus foraminis TaxID=279826 RepID=UPI0039A1B60E
MKLTWLKNKPSNSAGITWGVPWGQGKLNRDEGIFFKGAGGNIPLQSWPMAYWPDGSVKWTGHAAVLSGQEELFELEKGEGHTDDGIGMKVLSKEDKIVIDTGCLQFIINKKGTNIIEEIVDDGNVAALHGKLIALQERSSVNEGIKTTIEEPLESVIEHAEIEQAGPVRCTVKIEGKHQGVLTKSRQWLPFTLRLYFYQNTSSVRAVHTFFYDGDANLDFIKGLGMEFSVPLKGDPWNRNIRFAGDEGIYSEPAQLLLTRRHWKRNVQYEKQIAGEILDVSNAEYSQLMEHATQNAIWNDFKLTQDSADHYRMVKRTDETCSYVDSIQGTRAKGIVYVGGEAGGIAVGVRNFWQKFPSSLEARDLSKSLTKIKVWFWSPDSKSMDLRSYSQGTHVVSAYEGFDEMRSTPIGIANTNEVYLQFYKSPPSHKELIEKVNEWQSPLLLVCEPQHYYHTRALGVWSLPDASTPLKGKLEKQLDAAIDFYKNEVEQRRWYGFWNYGDFMHTYDPVRHQWRYDLGGFAWQNTELVPNIWLWYSFLRTGREDIFILAEAMTRHTSEVDCYHFGEYAGLGSRHNVVHWGCGCKEARISMAGLNKYYYFLTADERTGDLLTEVRDADKALLELNPMREFYSDSQFPTYARSGPDWAAFTSNWLSEWERTENPLYRDKIMKGILILKKLPKRLLSGPTFGYDPETSSLIHMGDGNEGGYHMVVAFGGPQAWMEIAQLIEDDDWKEMLAEFGEFYVLTNEEKKSRTNGELHDGLFSLPMLASGMVAYAAALKNDENLAEKAWNLLMNEEISQMVLPIESQKAEAWRDLLEIPQITTNTTVQWCLNTIIALELIGKYLPEDDSKKV